MFYYLFPTASLLSFLFLITSRFKAQTFFSKHRFFFHTLFAGFGITFLFCWSLTSLLSMDIDGQISNLFDYDSYMISGHLFFATLASSYCQFLIVPAVVGTLYEFHNRPKRSQK